MPTPSPATACSRVASPSHSACIASPSAVAAAAVTSSLAAITRGRRVSQNSSATIDRVDHSAPTDVAPTRNASAAPTAATDTAPSTPSPASENGGGCRKVESGICSAVTGGPHHCSTGTSSGRVGSLRHCCRPSVLSWICSCCACRASARLSGVGDRNASRRDDQRRDPAEQGQREQDAG